MWCNRMDKLWVSDDVLSVVSTPFNTASRSLCRVTILTTVCVLQMVLLLKEYLSSVDVKEATRCLQELEVPHFHHELVYEVLVFSIHNSSKF